MREVRLLIAALGVVALGAGALAACGVDPVGSQLAPVTESGDVIVVTPDSNLARQLAGAPDAPPAIELTLADGVAVPATTATLAWTTEAGEPSAEVVQALAVALGANGEVERDAAARGPSAPRPATASGCSPAATWATRSSTQAPPGGSSLPPTPATRRAPAPDRSASPTRRLP